MNPPISGRTALLGVLGDPVGHSLSPAMHNAALSWLGLDWVYLALPVAAPELAGALRALAAIGCRGLNVTLPHKHAAAALADEITPLARQLGAVNTLVPREGGGWLGTNTDVAGFLAPLGQRPGGVECWRGRRALVLGCGGSARAVVAALGTLQLAEILVAGREPRRLAAFLAQGAAATGTLRGLGWTERSLEPELARTDLVVNTTPVGMADAIDPAAGGRCPLGAEALAALRPTTTVYDLIYTPRPTCLLAMAARQGCTTVDGLEMLVQQGAASLRLWSGRNDVPVNRMRAAAMAQLDTP